jgi:hypothetical protein
MLSIARARCPDTMIVSLQRCDYCDSTGMSVLIRHALAVPNFRVVVPKEAYIRKIFRMANLEDRLGVTDSVADALRELRARSVA